MTLEPAGGNRFETIGVDTGSSKGTTVTSDAAADTYGSWTELDASTGNDANLLILNVLDCQTKAFFAVDLAIGAASSEQVIASKLRLFPYIAQGASFALPLFIPAGTRLSARVMDSTTSTRFVSVAGYLTYAPGVVGCARMELLGGADTAGEDVASDSGSAHTKGSWVEMGTSAFAYKYLFLAAQPYDDTLTAGVGQLVDIGVGAASSEQVMAANMFFHGDTQTDGITPPVTPLLPVSLDEGTRLALRQQSESASFQDAYTVKYSLYGLG